jgi:hypothetical protein
MVEEHLDEPESLGRERLGFLGYFAEIILHVIAGNCGEIPSKLH